MADLSISDDGLGTNILSLSGADTDGFALQDGVLYLKADIVLNYEGARDSYTVSVDLADPSLPGSNPISKDFNLRITNVNEAPTALTLSTTNVDENIPMHTRIADLSALDPDLPKTAQTFTYTLLPNLADNLIFYISGDGLYTSGSPEYVDYERQPHFDLVLQVSDQGGLTFQRNVRLFVNDLPDTPTYSASQSSTSILEGQGVSFGLSTTNLAPGTPIYWGVDGSGITASDFSDGQLSGSGILGADGSFAVLRSTVVDAIADPDERFSLSFFRDAQRTNIVAGPLSVQIKEPKVGSPSDLSDIIIGSNNPETISGVPLGSTTYGRGSIDKLTGNGGSDIFVLGIPGQIYYNGDASMGLAVISDFSIGQDRIQLSGAANAYALSTGRFNAVSGTFLSVAATGDRIGFLEGLRPTGTNPLNLSDLNQFTYV